MPFHSETIALDIASFKLLRDLIHERIGIFFEDGKCDILADKLSPYVIECGFDSFRDYYFYLKYDTATGDDWIRVMNALSVQETYFWREFDQIQTLVEVLVPEYFSVPGVQPLKIWCAACATGEEPLTIAMALNEQRWFDRAPIEIIASDASHNALAKARRGVYRERSFRNLSPSLRDKYFTEQQGNWKVDPALQVRVSWQEANLMDEARIAEFATAPVIFCRNVFIYFSQKAIRKTTGVFFSKMPTPGYLFVAAAESLFKINPDFLMEQINGAFVYVKR